MACRVEMKWSETCSWVGQVVDGEEGLLHAVYQLFVLGKGVLE